MDKKQTEANYNTNLGSYFKVKDYLSKYAREGEKPKTYIVLNDQLEQEIKKIALAAAQMIDTTAHDEGTCVLGAGICIQVFNTTKHKYPEYSHMVIRAPFQGNIGSYNALRPCLDWLQNNYPELYPHWEDGNMD